TAVSPAVEELFGVATGGRVLLQFGEPVCDGCPGSLITVVRGDQLVELVREERVERHAFLGCQQGCCLQRGVAEFKCHSAHAPQGRTCRSEIPVNPSVHPRTTSRSPPSTCCTDPIARRCTVPPWGAVIAASIFMASMVATVAPASTVSPSA